jgi:hypothetical protein
MAFDLDEYDRSLHERWQWGKLTQEAYSNNWLRYYKEHKTEATNNINDILGKINGLDLDRNVKLFVTQVLGDLIG